MPQSTNLIKKILKAQQNEVTESVIYNQLASDSKNLNNREILQGIAQDEKRQANYWKQHSKLEVKDNLSNVFFYNLIVKVLGLTFSVK